MTASVPTHLHGRYTTYTNHRCRCDACTAAWRDYCRELSHRRGRHRPAADVFAERRTAALARDSHGTEARYTHWGCRCDDCKRASREARARRRARVIA